jgi:hypothetical protein
MMKLKPAHLLTALLLTVYCTAGIGNLMAEQAPSPYQLSQQAADDAYNNGDYSKAYKKYLGLARRGDTFSQYRLSYMNFQGQSVDVDWAEAFAWAVLSAQGNNPQLVKYMAALGHRVPEEEAKRAAVKAKSYLNRWGDMAIAEDARRGAIQELRQCTGSRLGTRCEEVYSMRMPKFWDIGQVTSSPDGGGAGSGSRSYSTGNGVGGPVLNTRYFQNVRWGLRDVEKYIGENGGNVEIGELSTIDDDMGSSDRSN